VIGDVLTVVLLTLGALFSLTAAVGVLRLPDVFTRMHAITKAGSVGVGLIMAGVAVHFGDEVPVITRAAAIVVFVLVTSPVSAQMIGRAAYAIGIPLAERTHLDDLAGDYEDPEDLFEGRPTGSLPRAPSEREET
jgi:multicomponent Na+:H+ antiporter subunit G